jgi:hypothetical protein
MSVTLSLTRACNDGVALISKTEVVSAGAGPPLDESIPAASTDLAVAFAFAVAKLKAIFIQADRDMTIKTNSSGSPQETIALKAGQPFMWSLSDGYFAVPFAGNVTSLFVTLAAGTASVLQIRTVVDPT